MVGASAAYELARRGERVTIVDRGREPGSGGIPSAEAASWGNAGLLSIGHAPLTKPGLAIQAIKWMFDPASPLYIPPARNLDPGLLRWLWGFHRRCNAGHFNRCMDVLCRMGFPALEVIEALIRDCNIQCDYHRMGWLEVCATRPRLDKAMRDAELTQRYGYTVRAISGDELRQRDPCFRDEIVGAIHHTDSARCSPRDLLEGILQGALRAGATLRAGRGELVREGDSIRGVRIAGGEVLEADETIVAAGAWTTALARSVGVRAPMQAAKGYHMDLEGVPCMPSTGGVMAETFVAVTPMNGILRLAGTLELSGLSAPVNERRLNMLRVGASRYLRDLDRARSVATWSGLRPCTADGMPILGRPRGMRGVYLATGHAMMGMTLGPLTGRWAAMELCNERIPMDISMMRADRF